MLTRKERLISVLSSFIFEDVRAAYVDIARLNSSNRKKIINSILASGFEEVDCDLPLLPDGRFTIAILNKKYALTPDVFKQRKEEAILQAQLNLPTKSVNGSERLAARSCPGCGESLQQTSLCPSCAAGKIGYKYRYLCVCGVDFVTKERL